MAEYASIAAALSILTSSLGGALSSALPSTDAKAVAGLTAVARSHHVAAAGIRAAYAKAPYAKPSLRYLYGVGWVGSASNLLACRAAQVLGPDPAAAAAHQLRGSPKLLALLRAAHLTVAQASAALGRGAVDGCA